MQARKDFCGWGRQGTVGELDFTEALAKSRAVPKCSGQPPAALLLAYPCGPS